MDCCAVVLHFAPVFAIAVYFYVALYRIFRQQEKAEERAACLEYELGAFRYAARIIVGDLPACATCSAPATREQGPRSYRAQGVGPNYCDEHAPEGCVETAWARRLRPLIALLREKEVE